MIVIRDAKVIKKRETSKTQRSKVSVEGVPG